MKLLIVVACCAVLVLAETVSEDVEPDWAKQVKTVRDDCRSESNATGPTINLRFHHGKRHDHRGKYVEYVTCVLKKLNFISENGETNVENIREHLTEVLQDDLKRKIDHVVEHYGRNRSTEEETALHLWHSLRKHWKKYIRDRSDEGDDDSDDSDDESDHRHSHKHKHH